MIPAVFKETQTFNKSGTLDYIRGDACIVMGEKPFVMVITVERFETMEQAEQIIRDIARLLGKQLNFEN